MFTIPFTSKYQIPRKKCTFHWCWLNVHFTILLLIAVSFGLVGFWATHGASGSLFALIVSVSILFALVTRFGLTEEKHFLINDLVICGLFGLSIPAFFLGVGPLVKAFNFQMHDSYLLEMDKWLLGWLFPEGQVALWLDKSEILNPATFVGRLITEILQLSYTSYYLWGYLTLLMLMYRYAWSCYKGESADVKLIQLKMYICGWLFTYYLNFFFNLAFPAKSPRIYMKESYSHPLNGFGLAGHLRMASTDDSSFGTFPSGHVGGSFVAALYGIRLFGGFGKLSTVAAIFITFATVLLRYHYFVDVIGAIPVVLMGLLFGLFLPSDRYHKYVEEAKQRESKVRKVRAKTNDLEKGFIQGLVQLL